MSGREPIDPVQWREAQRWLAKAGEDLAAARLLLLSDLIDPAAFHTQQAAEKALKALSVAVGRDIRHTHDLETLAAEAHISWPDLVPFPSPLADISEWYLVSRYPDADEMAPTAEAIGIALAQVELLIRAIDAQAPPSPSSIGGSGGG